MAVLHFEGQKLGITKKGACAPELPSNAFEQLFGLGVPILNWRPLFAIGALYLGPLLKTPWAYAKCFKRVVLGVASAVPDLGLIGLHFALGTLNIGHLAHMIGGLMFHKTIYSV
jgi:hypothetical protein